MSDEVRGASDDSREPLRRDRKAVRAAGRAGGIARGIRSVPGLVASVALEIVAEIVFAALVALVSYLVYGEVRWLFVAAVWLAVNGVLVLLAVGVWLRGRRRR